MERRVPVKYEVKGRDNETGEMVNVLVIQVFCAIVRIPDFILYNIELGLLQFFVLRLFFFFFFKAEKCDLVGIFNNGGFGAKSGFQRNSLRPF